MFNNMQQNYLFHFYNQLISVNNNMLVNTDLYCRITIFPIQPFYLTNK